MISLDKLLCIFNYRDHHVPTWPYELLWKTNLGSERMLTSKTCRQHNCESYRKHPHKEPAIFCNGLK